MELAKINSKLPIKAYPEEALNKVILTQFTVWVANLLSLTDEVAAKRLELALPAIKIHCWSLGFAEIKKIFEMYADGKLSVKPIPNYFDRILLGKIVSAYNAQKVVVKKEINHIEVIEKTNKSHLIKFFNQYFKNKEINECYVVFVYDSLEKNGFIKLSKEEKIKLMNDAEVLFIVEKKENGNIRDKLKEFKKENIPNEDLVFISKKRALKEFLKKMSNDESIINEVKDRYKL